MKGSIRISCNSTGFKMNSNQFAQTSKSIQSIYINCCYTRFLSVAVEELLEIFFTAETTIRNYNMPR